MGVFRPNDTEAHRSETAKLHYFLTNPRAIIFSENNVQNDNSEKEDCWSVERDEIDFLEKRVIKSAGVKAASVLFANIYISRPGGGRIKTKRGFQYLSVDGADRIYNLMEEHFSIDT